jgi:hypothetical protein
LNSPTEEGSILRKEQTESQLTESLANQQTANITKQHEHFRTSQEQQEQEQIERHPYVNSNTSNRKANSYGNGGSNYQRPVFAEEVRRLFRNTFNGYTTNCSCSGNSGSSGNGSSGTQDNASHAEG